MNRSLRLRFVALFAIAVSVVLLMILAINNLGLEKYYISRKVGNIETAYAEIDRAVQHQSVDEISDILEECSEKYNLSIALVDSFTSRPIISSERDREVLLQRAQEKLFGTNGEKDRILKETENYQITRTATGIECFGYCTDNATMVLMNTPVGNIKENVGLSNRFLIYVALGSLAAGVIVVIILSGRAMKVSELEAENRRLQAALDEKEKQEARTRDFVSNVSHELKTPVALIQGYAEGLADGLCSDEESRKYYSDVIVDEAHRMTAVINQLLMLTSLESGTRELQMEPVDISSLAAAIAENSKLLADRKKASVIKNIPEGLMAVCDQFGIESVVSNYISNAVHHVNEGGSIFVSVSGDSGKILVKVINTGSHIPEAEMDHIWDKFYKVDKAHARSYGGSGIGLSIVKAVMDAHGQRYGVRNLNDGVEFWFELEAVK